MIRALLRRLRRRRVRVECVISGADAAERLPGVVALPDGRVEPLRTGRSYPAGSVIRPAGDVVSLAPPVLTMEKVREALDVLDNAPIEPGPIPIYEREARMLGLDPDKLPPDYVLIRPIPLDPDYVPVLKIAEKP